MKYNAVGQDVVYHERVVGASTVWGEGGLVEKAMMLDKIAVRHPKSQPTEV